MHTGPIAAAVLATIAWAEDYGLSANDWPGGLTGPGDAALFDACHRTLDADRADAALMLDRAINRTA